MEDYGVVSRVIGLVGEERKIPNNQDIHEFNMAVKQKIKQGWKLQGGVAISECNGGLIYVQTIIKNL